MITAEQREARRHTIGASDTPAIVGVDPWRTAADVYASKVYDLEDELTPAMAIGNALEPVLLDWAERELEEKIERNISLIDPTKIMSANLDGRTSIGVVEAKYVGPRGADYWGAPDTDEVPEHVAIQVQDQMYVAGLRLGYVPAAICRRQGLSFEMFYLAADDELIAGLVGIATAFWKTHVLPKVPPPVGPPNLEILKRIRRTPKSLIDLTEEAAELWDAREAARDGVKAVEEEVDKITAKLLNLLGDNEAGRLPDGRLLAYAPVNAGERLDVKRFKLEHPAMFAELATRQTRRVLRLKKGT